MTKDDLLECVELCAEMDDLNLRIADMELRADDSGGLAKIVFDRRLATMRKRCANIGERVSGWIAELNRLPSMEFRLIYMHYFEGESWQKVADELGYSVDYVKGKLRKKALRNLKNGTL